MIVGEYRGDGFVVMLHSEDRLDTLVEFHGGFTIAGEDREKFLEDVKALAERYRI